LSERVIRGDGIAIATEAFGDPVHPPILLIMGLASMLWWPDEFCRRLAGHGRFVLRYDQRETGLTESEPGDAPFTTEDLVDDVFRVLDGYGLPAAHLVGMSFGAMIGQHAALQQPSRVRSLTAISSSPVSKDTSHLPPPSEAYRQHGAAAEAVDWSDRDQAVASLVEEARILAGPAHPFDEARVREFLDHDVDRTGGYPTTSHFSWEGGNERQDRLQDLKPPLLVIHGTADPIYPVEHGLALSQAVDGAKLVLLEGGGHELHPADWDTIIGAIAAHTAPS
jgi:pimeloyl-ACP methyl ester carboxylesterase